jgi:squalene synthase HpnC
MDSSVNMGKTQPGLKEATKSLDDENFPVASRLIPAALRPHVHTFYFCVRAADDVADDPDMPPEEKSRLLAMMDEALLGDGDSDDVTRFAHLHRESALETGVPIDHARHLLQAFTMDVTKQRYRNWSELINYCMHSAAPVGRYLVDLHGGTDEAKPHTDALCNALQILNHLQDCKKDYRTLDRVYIPLDFLRREGCEVADLDKEACSLGMRRVIDHILDRTDELLIRARPGPARIRSFGLRLETAVIIAIAEKLSGLLRRKDPIAQRVELGKFQNICAALRGIARGVLTR